MSCWRGLIGVVSLGALALGAGCSSSSAPIEALPDRYAAQGQLLYNGKAPLGATVILWKMPVDMQSKDAWRQVKPSGTVNAQGDFELSSYAAADGAPSGEYAVTAIWTSTNGQPGADMFKGRFSNPAEPIAKVKIGKGSNAFPPIKLNGPEIDPARDATPEVL